MTTATSSNQSLNDTIMEMIQTDIDSLLVTEKAQRHKVHENKQN
jgi:hypothetical protein